VGVGVGVGVGSGGGGRACSVGLRSAAGLIPGAWEAWSGGWGAHWGRARERGPDGNEASPEGRAGAFMRGV
jgi:hypothetical protein